MISETHVCRKCETLQPLAAFYPSAIAANDWRCKKCRMATGRIWRESNRGRVNRNERKRIAAMPREKRQQKHRRYYSKNREKVASKNRRWQQENAERFKAFAADWHRANKHRRQNEQLGRKYGLRPGDYEVMLSAQGGGCAICKRTENFDGRRFAVDHCHRTGRVRGLLCTKCNVAVGLLGDSPALLMTAIEYLYRG